VGAREQPSCRLWIWRRANSEREALCVLNEPEEVALVREVLCAFERADGVRGHFALSGAQHLAEGEMCLLVLVLGEQFVEAVRLDDVLGYVSPGTALAASAPITPDADNLIEHIGSKSDLIDCIPRVALFIEKTAENCTSDNLPERECAPLTSRCRDSTPFCLSIPATMPFGVGV
jgi:hypothetical protein